MSGWRDWGLVRTLVFCFVAAVLIVAAAYVWIGIGFS